MNKRFIVRLSTEEREQLEALVAKGKAAAHKLTRARILLKADCSETGPAWSDERISLALDVGTITVHRVRRDFVEGGLERALVRRPVPHRPRMLDGEQEAHLIALACGRPAAAGAAGRSASWPTRWSSSAISTRSRMRPSGDAQKNELKPWTVKMWCIPPDANPEFVWKMEDVLEVYRRPYDPLRPWSVWTRPASNSSPETRRPQEAEPGRERRVDSGARTRG